MKERKWTLRAAGAIALGIVAGVIASAGTAGVVLAGFSLSFDAIRAVAVAAHIRPDWAWMLPVSVDGAMAVASVVAIVLSRLNRTPWYAWTVVVLGAVISVLCNALHAIGDGSAVLRLEGWQRMVVSGIPPVMLALSVHLLVELVTAVAGRLAAPAVEARTAPAAAAPVEVQKLPVPTAPPAPPLTVLPPAIVADLERRLSGPGLRLPEAPKVPGAPINGARVVPAAQAPAGPRVTVPAGPSRPVEAPTSGAPNEVAEARARALIKAHGDLIDRALQGPGKARDNLTAAFRAAGSPIGKPVADAINKLWRDTRASA